MCVLSWVDLFSNEDNEWLILAMKSVEIILNSIPAGVRFVLHAPSLKEIFMEKAGEHNVQDGERNVKKITLTTSSSKDFQGHIWNTKVSQESE